MNRSSLAGVTATNRVYSCVWALNYRSIAVSDVCERLNPARTRGPAIPSVAARMTTLYCLIFAPPEVLSAPILIAGRPCRELSKPLMREYFGYSVPIAPVSNCGTQDHVSSSGPLRSSSPHPKTDSGFGDISCILPPPTDATDVNAVLSSLSRGLLERPGRSCSGGTPGDCCSASRAMCIRRSHLDGAGESRD